MGRDFMDWEPREQDIEWTKNVLDNLEINQDWMEGEMAFRRTGESTLALLTRTERAEGAAGRVKQVLDALDWELDEEHLKVIPDDPMAAAEMMQQQAESWVCPSCNDTRVVNMNLENSVWSVEGQTNYVDEEGNSLAHDRWVVGIACQCGETVHLSPDDYYLVAGEVNFYTWNFIDSDGVIQSARVLAPEQIIECVDSNTITSLRAQHLGTTFQGNTVPPHMRGTFCVFVEGMALGEEE
tara:strand:+ start:329 stop:1045 length:717 start_codon:yes stop_codon:yes gene_type:complete